MSQDRPIVNRVAQSGIITLNLEDFYPTQEFVTFDIKPFLFMELILKEKDFRKAMKEHDWTAYEGKNVAIICTADAVVPVWAYMLISTKLAPHAHFSAFGNEDMLRNLLFQQALHQLDVSKFEDKRVVVKGCGQKPVPFYAYTEITRLLKPVVKSLMYGEPCSTVPIYKQPRK